MPAAQYCVEDFLSTRTLDQVDETVAEIFGVMLGLAARHDVASSIEDDPGGEDSRTCLIGFSGAMRGSCAVWMNTSAARTIASAMLGGMPDASAADEIDEDSVNDSVGEIGNMLAAGWKNRVDALSGRCFLSPPAVISGRSYRVHPTHASVKIVRNYVFEGHAFTITINCVELSA